VKPVKYRSGKYKRKYSVVFSFAKSVAGFLKYLTIPLTILLFIGTLYLAFRTSYFHIDKITFEGIKEVNTEQLEEVAAKYKEKNIYSVNLTELEREVQNLSVYIKNVYARKILPNKLIVEVDERNPELVIINFSGVYLVDADEFIIAHPMEEAINFTEDEWLVYSTNRLDASIIKDRIIANLKEKGEDFEEDDFDYDVEVNETEKQRIQQEIRGEMNQAIKIHFDSLDAAVSQEDFAGLPRVYFYERGEFEEGIQIEASRLNLTSEAISFLDSYEESSVIRAAWLTPFSLYVYTLEGKEFVFGSNRDPDLQLEDLDIILNELKTQKKGFQRIDVRSDIIRVK